jgi:hypothetical protein
VVLSRCRQSGEAADDHNDESAKTQGFPPANPCQV